MWSEAGIQFRSNLLLEPGASIQLHAHSYDHVAMLLNGVFDAVVVSSNGERKQSRLTAPHRVTIKAWDKHGFTLLENSGGPGEILCMWGA